MRAEARMVVLAVLWAVASSCTELDDVCMEWQEETCEAYHDCGMMQGVGECGEHAALQCDDQSLPVDPPPHCLDLTASGVDTCVSAIKKRCPTFESLESIPECASFMECFGWPM